MTAATSPQYSEAQLREAVQDYHQGTDREDWDYTYAHLDSQTLAMFTEEWY